MSNPTQKLRNPQVGQRVTAAREESVISMIKRLIVGGNGITTRMLGDQVVIEATKSVGGGAGSGGGLRVYQAASPTLLRETYPDVPRASLGWITDGDYEGAIYCRNIDNTNWVGMTVWEA